MSLFKRMFRNFYCFMLISIIISFSLVLLLSKTCKADEVFYNSSGTMSIKSDSQYAGAISGLWVYPYGNINLVDNHDHGRQIQIALTLDDRCETYNPTEAGTSSDTTQSSSILVQSVKEASNVLFTESLPAYWLAPGTYTPYGPPNCNTDGYAYNTTLISKEHFYKRITNGIGAGDLQKVIKYQTSIYAGDNYSKFTFEAPTGYHSNIFTKFYENINGVWTELGQIQYDGYTIIDHCTSESLMITTNDGSIAIGIWSPNSYLCGARYGGSVTKWNAVQSHENITIGQVVSAVTYMVVGTKAEVESIMNNRVIDILY